MSMLSEMIREFVNDPSVGKEYGKWGALNREQRKLIRLLCDTCDHFERAADDLAKEREKIMQTICDHCSPSFDKNGKPVCVFDAVNGYKAIGKVLKGNQTPAEQRSIEMALISEICKGCNEEFPNNACEPSECRIRQRLINIPSDVAEHGEWKVETYKTSDAKFIRCSVCNSVIDSNFTHIDENEFGFCPYCGAKMDGGKNG